MKGFKDLRTDLDNATRRAITLRDRLCEKILSWPQNPKFTELSSIAGAIPASALASTNLSVPSADWRLQYKAIVDELEGVPVASVTDRLEEILAAGQIRRGMDLRPEIAKLLRIHVF